MNNDVSIFWDRVRGKVPMATPPFHELHPQHQMLIIQSVNTIMNVLYESQTVRAADGTVFDATGHA
jgi:hypothetical protein